MRATYVMYRYNMISSDGEVLTGKSLLDHIYAVSGLGAPYRVSEPSEDDYRNYVIDPDEKKLAGKRCAVMDIGYVIDGRMKHEYDRDRNKINIRWERADDVRHSRAIFLLDHDIVAFRDGSGERLSADSAVARFKAIVEFHSSATFEYERTASMDDIREALSNLKVTEFSFDARPFNPHPSAPGDILHELLKKANVSKLRGVAVPAPDKSLSVTDDGLLDEVTGLAEKIMRTLV